MESKNTFQKDTCKMQEVSVISKIHNMQWLKSKTPLSGHAKPNTNKEIMKSLKEELETSVPTNESTISVPNISADNNLKLVNSAKIVVTTSDNKYNCDTESKVVDRSDVFESMESISDTDDNMTHYKQQLLLLHELEKDEMISIAIEESLLALQMKTQIKLEDREEEKDKERSNAECNFTALKIKDDTSEMSQEGINDNNNNDKLNIICEADLKPAINLKNDMKIVDMQSDSISNEGADKDQSNNSLHKETDTSFYLNNPNKISVSNNNNTTTSTPSTSSNSKESKRVHKDEVKQSHERKAVSKVITRNSVSTSTPNRKNSAILGQATESKMKYGIKQSIKNLSTEVVRNSPDKKINQSSQSMLNTSKVLRSKSNLQPKKESVITKPSPEVTSRYSTKNIKESEQNKTTPLNTVNKQCRVNRMCYTSKKEESGSVSKVYNNSSKTVSHTVKGMSNYSNSPNSAQSTNKQSFNIAKTQSTNKKISETSNVDNKCENMEQKIILKNDQVSETLTLKEECVNGPDVKDNVLIGTLHKEINPFSNEIKETCGSNKKSLPNEHSTKEYLEEKQTNTNPFLQDLQNLPTLNKSQTDTEDLKDITNNDLNSKSTQLDNVAFTNIPYDYHVSQQNAHQEQMRLHQNFVQYIPDQFIVDCSVNTALPKFHSNIPYSNTNTMQLNQYGDMQTMSNKPSGAQYQNCSSPNVSPPSTGNTNTLQYQLPNMLPCSSQSISMIRSPPGACIYPVMSQEDQFNLQTYGMSPPYFMNPVCVCRNDCYPLHLQHWNLSHNYPVPLLQNPYSFNYNSFCNQNVQSDNMIRKNTVARPIQGRIQGQNSHEQNSQRNYGKPVSNFGYNVRSSQNNKIYDTKLQGHGNKINTRESIDFNKEKQDREFLSDKETNNLPMISPKACMIYGSGFSKNNNTIRPQMKLSERTDSVSNCHFQYQKNNGYRYVSKEHLSSDAGIGRGKTRYTHSNRPNYKTQY